MTKHAFIPTPLGDLLATADDGAITGLYFPNGRKPAGHRDDADFTALAQQLREYFAGERQQFDLPLRASGNEFEHLVWDALREIPFGHTATYGEVAERIGHPRAARAVGAANGRNPIAIIVPCHRVIGAGGKLTGYAGGLERKRALLQLEGALLV